VSKSGVEEARADQQPSLLKRVQEMLGVRRLRSDQDLVKLVEERLDNGVVEALRQSGLTDDEIYALIVPRRTTLAHRRARHADQRPSDWPEKTDVTRTLGDGWLGRGSAALLTVPSAIVPETFNVLLNPAHHDG